MKFDEKQIDEAIKENYQALYMALLHVVFMDRTKAEDFTQDTVAKVIGLLREGRYREQNKGTLLAWMIMVGKNLVMDYYRKESRIPTSSIDIESEGEVTFERTDLKEYYYSEIELSYEESIARNDEIKKIKGIVKELPFNQREVFILRYSFGYQFRDIAIVTKASINTVLGRMRYALHNIRRALGKDPILIQKELCIHKGRKVCIKCNNEKEKKEFSRHRKTKDKLNYWCKECAKKRSKQLRAIKKRA